MKFIVLILSCWALALVLSSCGEAIAPDSNISWSTTQDASTNPSLDSWISIPWIEDSETSKIEEVTTIESVKWAPVVLFDFTPNMPVSSPLEIKWKAPRSWFFEWIFPVALMVESNDVVAETGASGDWLVPISENAELSGEDMIDFTATLDFSSPLVTKNWKLQLRSYNPSDTEENNDMIEIDVIFD